MFCNVYLRIEVRGFFGAKNYRKPILSQILMGFVTV